MKLKLRPTIAGKVVIVTGASAGIGEATAREFARAGAITVLAARRAGRLKRLQQEIEEMGGEALAVPTDLTDPDQITDLVEKTVSRYGRIDVLANIAGWALYHWLEEMEYKDLRRAFDVNVIGLAELTRQVIPIMKRQRSGFILNMSSYASRVAVPPLTVYASTKYAVEGLTDGLRRGLLPWGITVIRIHPSAVTGTEFNQRVVREGGLQYRPVPIGRVSRERLARHIVRLIEKPQRAFFISRTYEVLVLLNRLFPEVVDAFMAMWVRLKQKNEIPPADEVKPVEYRSSYPLGTLLGGFLIIALVMRFLGKK